MEDHNELMHGIADAIYKNSCALFPLAVSRSFYTRYGTTAAEVASRAIALKLVDKFAPKADAPKADAPLAHEDDNPCYFSRLAAKLENSHDAWRAVDPEEVACAIRNLLLQIDSRNELLNDSGNLARQLDTVTAQRDSLRVSCYNYRQKLELSAEKLKGLQNLISSKKDALLAECDIEKIESAYLAAIFERANTSSQFTPDSEARFMQLFREGIIAGEKAKTAYPQPNYVVAKFAEESGEVVKASIHYAEDRADATEVADELAQVFAMAWRLFSEGDATVSMPSINEGL